MPVAQQTKAVTAQESLVLVRNLMRTSVATIAYLRNVFPDECFTDRTMSGVHLKSFVPNEETSVVTEWLEKGVFHALQRQYLRVMSLVILTGDETQELEHYDFKVRYPASGPQLSVKAHHTGSPAQSKAEVAQSIRMLLRKLVTLTQSMAELPSSRVITMRLLFDASTPADYEPPFFQAASEGARRQFTHPAPGMVDLRLGTLHTAYHLMDLRCRAPREWLELSQENDAASGAKAAADAGSEVPEVKVIVPKEEPAGSDDEGGGASHSQMLSVSQQDQDPGAVLQQLHNASSLQHDAFKAFLFVAARRAPTSKRAVAERFSFDSSIAAGVYDQLSAWQLVKPAGQGCVEVDMSDARSRSLIAQLLSSPLSASLEPHELASVEDAAASASKKRGRAAEEDTNNTQASSMTLYGDEPKISAIERPVKQARK